MKKSFSESAVEKMAQEQKFLLERRSAEAEAARARGYVRKNVYLCDTCGAGWVSVDVHEGVTPFMDQCPICEEGMGSSLMYNVPQEILADKPARVEWRSPTPADFEAASDRMRIHYRKLGLKRVVVDPTERGTK